MAQANAAPLFAGLKRQPSFNKKIHISSGDREDIYLRECRRKIRAALRSTFSNFRAVLADDAQRALLAENRDSNFGQRMRSIDVVDVRFLTQGSHAYQTLVRPCSPGPQEIDLDDGIYFPMPFMDGRPLFASAGLFALVRKSLTGLVVSEGWEFGKRKSTCIRIKLPKNHAHIDLPLFAVEQDAFAGLQKALRTTLGDGYRSTNLNEALQEYARDQRLTGSQILLAHRDEDWLPSDPKIIHDWFENMVATHGPALRRVCRYLKAWRDKVWLTGGPSSIALMAIAVAIFDAMEGMAKESRDDLLTSKVAKEMGEAMRKGSIVGPETLPAFDKDWSSTDRMSFARAADELSVGLDAALHSKEDGESVVEELIGRFGTRFPNEPASVSFDNSDQIDALAEVPAATVAAPIVSNSVSG